MGRHVVINAAERFLVTGAFGCIGSWVIRELAAAGAMVVGLDVGADPRRLRQIMTPEALGAIPLVRGDIADLATIEQTIDTYEITNVIHLAALQVPFCRADPPQGARVNVLGTVNVLEAVRRRRSRMHHVVYASSIAAYDEPGTAAGGPLAMSRAPSTIYGVYKRTNEATALRYWEDEHLSSIGLRPHTVYGLGRDQGLTAAPTTAMLAAAGRVPYQIPFGGRCQLPYVADIAAMFINASRARYQGAAVVNPPGTIVHVSDVIAAIERAAPEAAGMISFAGQPLPFPAEVDSRSFTQIVGH